MSWRKNPASNWKLYCIIDKSILKRASRRTSRRTSPKKIAQTLFRIGSDAVQLRYKNCPSHELVRIAKEIRKLASKYGKTLLINDRVDVAKASNAKGVHLGSGDLPIATARYLLGREKIFGKTIHSISEARKAVKEKPDYISAGPIFATTLKKNLKGQGLTFIKKIKKHVPRPLFAIGGINKRNVKAVFRSGADGVCVTRAIFEAKEILKELGK